MTRVRKFSGKTVDEATETALAELGVELEDVDVRVIRPGRSGILGFGGETAEIEDPRQKSTNQMMLWMMPIMFGAFTWQFPAGLAVYILFSNIIGVVRRIAR